MIKAMLELGRVSNLPTVLSNCLAAWVVMSGGAAWFDAAFWWLCGGAFLIYVGGTALNDVFDVAFDREHRKERPIPSGRVSEKQVKIGGSAAMAAGAALMIFLGGADPAYVLALVGAVVFYDYIHKKSWIGPWVMGLCRFLLFVAVASAFAEDARFVALMIVGGMVGLYVVGLTFAAKGESGGGKVNKWGAILVFVPVALLAFRLLQAASYAPEEQVVPLAVLAVFLLWAIWGIRVLKEGGAKIGKAVEMFLAGLVLLDACVVAFYLPQVALYMLAGFLLTLVLQKVVPAT